MLQVLPGCSALRETGTALLPHGILMEAGSWGKAGGMGSLAGCRLCWVSGWVLGASLSVKL